MILIFIIFLLLLGAFLYVVARKPDDFRISRSRVFPGVAPERIHALLEDFREWRKWSPWEEMDPDLQRTYSGKNQGVGAVYSWKGNKRVGEGRMEITEINHGHIVRLKLDFIKPMKANNMTDFTLSREGDGTRLTWTMYGPAGFMSKLFQTFMNIDRMVGRDFEKGLESMARALAR